MKCIEDEIPFDVPDGWEWCRISSVALVVTDGEHKTPKRCNEYQGYYLLSARNIQNGYLSLDDVDYVDEEEYIRISKRCNPRKNDVLLSCSGSLGRVTVVTDEKKYTMVRSAAMIRFLELDPFFEMQTLQSTELQTQIQNSSKQTAQANLFQGAILSLLIPVPPLCEQTKISNIVSSIIKKVENINNEKNDLANTIQLTKSKILNLAIQGKLVPQNLDDEPASVLLKRIRTEKDELIKAGKIKRDKKESVIFRGDDNSYYEKFADGKMKCIDSEIPFEVPTGWQWERLGNISTIARGGSPRPIEKFITKNHDGINWIKIGDTEKNGKYIFSTKEKIILEGASSSRYVHNGDFLLTNSMSFGRPYILKVDGCIHDGWLVIGNIASVFYQDFLYYALSSDFMFQSLSILAAGSTVKNLKSESVKSVLFPIPPMSEQIQIANKLVLIMNNLKIAETALT